MTMEGIGVGAMTVLDQPRPHVTQRLGSGVRCPAVLDDEGTVCDSGITTRLRGGVDSYDRPIAEFLCEDCGTTFVGITVGLDPRVRFADVNHDPLNMEQGHPIPVAKAIRRTERMPRRNVLRAKMARLEVCTECGNIVATDNGEWEAHQRGHLED